MKPRSLVRWLSMTGAAAFLMVGAASAADVHVMISAGFYDVYSELGPAFERASGHHLVTTRGPSMGGLSRRQFPLDSLKARPRTS
jgi:molybdate transport system substrate-binding protein